MPTFQLSTILGFALAVFQALETVVPNSPYPGLAAAATMALLNEYKPNS